MSDSRIRPAKRGTDARNKLAEKFQWLPRRVVKDIAPTLEARRIEREDAEQIGMLALLRSAELYDRRRRSKREGFAGRPADFKTYAYVSIRRRLERLPANLAIEIPLRPQFQKAAALALATCQWPECDEEGRAWEPEATGHRSDPALTSWLESGLRFLDARSRRLLELRYHEGFTLEEAGDVFGVTRERVRQIEREALAKLRKVLAPGLAPPAPPPAAPPPAATARPAARPPRCRGS